MKNTKKESDLNENLTSKQIIFLNQLNSASQLDDGIHGDTFQNILYCSLKRIKPWLFANPIFAKEYFRIFSIDDSKLNFALSLLVDIEESHIMELIFCAMGLEEFSNINDVTNCQRRD